MAKSKSLNELEQAVAKLRDQFLPETFDPIGSYSEPDRVQAHTRAFLILCHAEVETYFEAWAKDIARQAEKVWNGSRRIAEPLVFMMATLGEKVVVPTSMNVPIVKDCVQRFEDEVGKVFPRYYKQVNDNNGIKEGNVHSLFGPIGVPASAFGTTLLASLDAFGALRGDHAHHSSAKASVQSVLDPETEYKRAATLAQELEPVDQWLQDYGARVSS